MSPNSLGIALFVILLSSCALPSLPGDAAPVVKIGLIAPFEGLGRPLGYSVLPAVKIAVAEANASGELGRYRVALVALNDDAYPRSAVEQVKALAQDPDVVAVLGPWGSDTAETAAPAFGQAGLPALVGAPIAGRAPGVVSLCPPPAQLAEALLAEAARSGGQSVEVTGPFNALAQAIATAGGPAAGASRAADPTAARVYTGDAAAAADDWLRWRGNGWDGTLLGGPDLARPWFAGRVWAGGQGVDAGAAVQAKAVVCTMPGQTPDNLDVAYRAESGHAPDHEARLAYAGVRLLLTALASDIRAHGSPTRAEVAAALAREGISPATSWVEFMGNEWQPRP